MKSIFVCGGAGYIGSHTVLELMKQGYAVTIFDNLEFSSQDYLERLQSLAKETVNQSFEFIQGDLRNPEEIAAALKTKDFFGVVHFAAYKNVYDSIESPDQYYRNNVLGTFNLVEAMRKANIHNIVFSSTCSVYGQPSKLPISEEFPLNPLSPYARTKAAVELMLEDYQKLGLNSVRLRYFNAAGAHPSGKIGEDPKTLLNVIPRIFGAVLGKWNLQIYGNQYATRDGYQIRDYIHVQDLATAHVQALKYLEDNQGSIAINLGTGKGTSNLELMKAVEEVTGKSVPHEVVAPKGFDPIEVYGDNSRAKEKLGWQPIYDYHDIIKHDWQWYQNVLERWN